MVKIAHARIGSNGQVSGDAVGDQGKEVCITDWYNKPWDFVLRPKAPQVALRISNAAKAITEINCGYDQSRRNDLIKDAEAVEMVFKNITKPTSCDCSSFVTACCINSGVNKSYVVKNGNASTTRTLRANLDSSGMFVTLCSKEYTQDYKLLKIGDILLSEGHHTVVVVSEEPQGVKSITDVAKEVIAGQWGNGEQRRTNLASAGYDYNEVQREVNRLLKG